MRFFKLPTLDETTQYLLFAWSSFRIKPFAENPTLENTLMLCISTFAFFSFLYNRLELNNENTIQPAAG